MSRYGVPLFVTENGIADSRDALRPDYLASHLKEIAAAVSRGVDVRGYYHWSLLDNFEWVKGFTPRFGLWEVDYDTFERKPRPSAKLYAEIIRRHPSGEAPQSEAIERAYSDFRNEDPRKPKAAPNSADHHIPAGMVPKAGY
jgi:beta-glucosidase/6-phospho-beta-glucosidase/beta-galactosidase